jgi:hypothetical protein
MMACGLFKEASYVSSTEHRTAKKHDKWGFRAKGVSEVAAMRHLVLFGWHYKASSPNPLLPLEKGAKVPSLRERGF